MKKMLGCGKCCCKRQHTRNGIGMWVCAVCGDCRPLIIRRICPDMDATFHGPGFPCPKCAAVRERLRMIGELLDNAPAMEINRDNLAATVRTLSAMLEGGE